MLKPDGVVLLFGVQPFTSMVVMSNLPWFRYELIWDRQNVSGFLDANEKPLQCHENIEVFYAKQPTYRPQQRRGKPNHGRRVGSRRAPVSQQLYRGKFYNVAADTSGWKYPRSILPQFPKHPAREKRHPFEKPFALMEYLVRTYSNPGDVVLDNCFGSCPTGEACLRTGRDFIGMELLGKYFRVGVQRIEDVLAELRLQPTLFSRG